MESFSRNIKNKSLKRLLDEAVEKLRNFCNDNLVSVVFYGSNAREESKISSDIDLFIVLNKIEDFLLTRRKIYLLLNEKKENIEFSPLIVDINSVKKLAPIHFELYADGKILYDTHNFIKDILNRVKELILMHNIKRYKTEDNCYGWILKEEPMSRGEIIDINFMNSKEESIRRIKLGRRHLYQAEEAYKRLDFPETVHHAQLSVENSAKTIISIFRIPSWTHDPSYELLSSIENIDIPSELKSDVIKLAHACKQLAPEHATTNYGTIWHLPEELYKKEDAEEALLFARESIVTAENFFKYWFKMQI